MNLLGKNNMMVSDYVEVCTCEIPQNKNFQRNVMIMIKLLNEGNKYDKSLFSKFLEMFFMKIASKRKYNPMFKFN